MTMRIGDDGEIEFLEPTEKPKRKKKSFTQRGLQGCAQLFFLAVFFVFGSIGGFAFYFVRNPGSSQNAHSTVVCVGQIKTISVAGASVLFPKPVGSQKDGRMLLGMDGHSSEVIDQRPGNVDSLSLAEDKTHIVESRYEKIAPYFFIYTWVLSNFAQWNEQLLTDGRYPSWSPDMKQIAFFRFSGSDSSGLYVMNANGSDIRQVRQTYNVTAPASWSPDGTQLVFSTSDYNEMPQNVYIINIADKTERTLIKNGLSAEYPAWSPDGKTVAYVSHDIYAINIDGTNRHNLTNGKFPWIANLGWSPDSLSITFLGQDAANNQGIYVMDSDGAGLRTLYRPCIS